MSSAESCWYLMDSLLIRSMLQAIHQLSMYFYHRRHFILAVLARMTPSVPCESFPNSLGFDGRLKSDVVRTRRWRLRLSSITGIGSISPSRRQGFLELAHLFVQSTYPFRCAEDPTDPQSCTDWPTIVTLVPRAFTSLALLVSFTSSPSSVSSNAIFERDPAYFRPDGTLSTFGVVCNIM